MSSERPRVYLAGPDVFLRDLGGAAQRKKDLCNRYGFEGIFPLDAEVSAAGKRRDVGLRISEANEGLIRSCALVVAQITPFRGISADVGTVYEMGYARGLGKIVFAYSNVALPFDERIRASLGAEIRRDVDGTLRDGNGMSIEQFEMVDNLMIEGCVVASGGALIVERAPQDRLFTHLDGFEKCLEKARQNLGGPRPEWHDPNRPGTRVRS